MIKKLYRLFFFLSALVFILLSFIYIPFHDFDSLELKENISYLASDKIGGRICGSEENDLVAEEIAKKLSELGLSPLSPNYKDGFQITVPYKTNDKGVLKIRDFSSKDEIKTFSYGVDFKEDLLNFKENSISLSKEDDLKVFENALTFKKNGNLFFFYVPKENNFDFRSSFINDSKISFSVALNKNTFTEIVSSLNSGNEIFVELPYSTKVTEAFNVAGKIEGKDSSLKPLILTAHFDHLGTDCLNNVYCGALDNASGSCFLLEVAKVFSSLKVKPERDIIFVFLNAEEFGLIGSEEFSKKHSSLVSGSQVINIDMIGAPNTELSAVRSEKDKSTASENLEDIKNLKENLEISYEDSSDHASFSKYGADSLTLTHNDTSKIHTPDDKLEFISTKALEKGFNLLSKKVSNYCYSPFSRILFNSRVYILSFLICLIYIFYKSISSIKHKKKK